MSAIVKVHSRPEPWADIRNKLKRRWIVPFIYMEWLGQWGAYLLSRWSLLSILEYLGTLSLLVAVITYFTDAPSRLEQKHYQAWQVINTAQGKGGGGGRLDALQDLNDDRVPLVGVDLSLAFLQHIQLPNADLRRCTLNSADLLGSSLRNSNLEFSAAVFTNLRGADLYDVNLHGTDFSDADLMGANLGHANVAEVDFSRADLRNADLAALKNMAQITDMTLANIAGVRNAPEGFMAFAKAHGAVEMVRDHEWQTALRATANKEAESQSPPASRSASPK